MIRIGLALAAFAALAACASTDTAQAPAAPPATETAAAPAADPYLWLEEVEGERALAWVHQQNDRSLPILQNDARYARLESAALEVSQSRERLPLGAIQDGYLYNFWQDQEHVRGIWRRSRLDAYARNAPRWETLIDMDALAASENANWVWHGADCDPSGTRCMIALSNGGLDAATQREFDLTTKRFVEGGFVVPEAKANVTWFDRDTLMIATNWGEGSLTESGYPFILKVWRRGTPLSSATEIARGRSSDVLIAPANLEDVDGTHVALVYQGETFFESISSIYDGTNVRRITLPRKATIQGLFHQRLIVTLEQEWSIGGRTIPNGTLIAMPVATATSATPAVEILFTPGPRQSIENVALTTDAVLVSGFENVRGTLQRFELRNNAWQGSRIDLPPSGVISLAGASTRDHRAFVVFEDFLTPPTLYSLESRATRARPVRSLPAQFDASPYTVEQFQVASRDGTMVPYFVVHRRDMQLNSQNPTLLYAYGGFQLSQTPAYNPYVGRLWLDQGGVYVLANIRGGGEFGPAWHDAGLKLHRQVIYDDFYAVERDLVTRNITSPRRLGISGRSNGGLLMGVMLNQHPEMVHAAVIGSPLLDMLRYDQLLAGASWVDEYGSPQVPEERAWLEQLTPYQNLRPGPDFPLVFIYTSTKDDRVHPGHARKYGARLAELGVPFLYYENTDGGHQATANLREAARRRALEYTYLSQRLID